MEISVYDTPMTAPTLYLIAALLGLLASWYLLPLRWAALLSWLARRMAGLKSKQCQVGEVHWQYLEGGRGPTLVLLHGMAAEADHWLAIAARLRSDYRLLIPDLPGFGGSTPPQELDFRIQAQSQRLEAWLDQLGVHACLLAGNSMGAWIAADFSARHPDRVRALWLQDAFGLHSARQSAIMRDFVAGQDNPFLIRNMTDYRRLVKQMFHRAPPLPYPLQRAGFVNAARLAPELERMQAELLEQSTPVETLLSGLQLPTLIEWGEEDRATDPDGVRVLSELLPNCQCVTHARVGHLPMLEAPGPCLRAWQSFATEHKLMADVTASHDSAT